MSFLVYKKYKKIMVNDCPKFLEKEEYYKFRPRGKGI
jgi:hypothetical protein